MLGMFNLSQAFASDIQHTWQLVMSLEEVILRMPGHGFEPGGILTSTARMEFRSQLSAAAAP